MSSSSPTSGPPAPVPAYPWAGPVPPPAAPPPRRPGRTLLVGLAAAAVLAALGVPLGLLWAALAPGVPVVQADNGPVLAEPQPEQFIAADAWFTLLGLAFGVLAAVGLWWALRRRRGAVGLAALLLGTVAAALIAWWLGRNLGLSEYERWRDTAAIGATYVRPPDLRAGEVDLLWGFLPWVRGDLLVAGFAAVVTYTLLAGWASDPDLGAHGAAAPQVSWDSPGPPAPTAAPAPPAPGPAAPPPD